MAVGEAGHWSTTRFPRRVAAYKPKLPRLARPVARRSAATRSPRPCWQEELIFDAFHSQSAFTIELFASWPWLPKLLSWRRRLQPEVQVSQFRHLAAGIGFLFVGPSPVLPVATRDPRCMAQADVGRRGRAKAEIERRIAGLGADVAALRDNARIEMENEAERFNQTTQEMLQKIERSAEMEISSMAKAARQELKQYSADLALDLAKQKIQNRMNNTVQTGLVTRFTRLTLTWWRRSSRKAPSTHVHRSANQYAKALLDVVLKPGW